MPEGLKNGFTKIANPILESLMYANLTKREYKICLCILRYGYGYGKEKSEIRNYQRIIAKLTGLNEVVIKATLFSLQNKNIVKIDKLNKTLSFNRHSETWKLNKILSPEIQELGKNLIKREVKLNETLSKTKQNIKLKPPKPTPDEAHRPPKERKKKRKYIYSSFTPQKQKNLFGEIWIKYPSRVGKKEAEKHFKVSVKNNKDLENINLALKNYLVSKRVKDGFIQDGSTWFNNWQDWIKGDATKPIQLKLKTETPEQAEKKKRKDEAEEKRKIEEMVRKWRASSLKNLKAEVEIMKQFSKTTGPPEKLLEIIAEKESE